MAMSTQSLSPIAGHVTGKIAAKARLAVIGHPAETVIS